MVGVAVASSLERKATNAPASLQQVTVAARRPTHWADCDDAIGVSFSNGDLVSALLLILPCRAAQRHRLRHCLRSDDPTIRAW